MESIKAEMGDKIEEEEEKVSIFIIFYTSQYDRNLKMPLTKFLSM